jgi:hypothetical protein
VTLNRAALAGRYGVGAFRQVLVTAQNGLGAESARAGPVNIVGSTKSLRASGQQFASDWNLDSDWFFPVDQPLQQVTWLHYVKLAASPQIYRQFHLGSGGWTDFAPVGAADWQAKCSPAVATVAAAVLK